MARRSGIEPAAAARLPVAITTACHAVRVVALPSSSVTVTVRGATTPPGLSAVNPAGPAPLITTSGPPVAAGTRSSSGPTGRRSRRQVQTGGGDQIEERATDGVSGHTGEGKLAGGGLFEEGETDDAGQAAADDHRPLPVQSPS